MARGQGSFGLSSSRGGRGGNFRGNFRGRGRGRGGASRKGNDTMPVREDDGTQLAERFERVAQNDEVDEKLGFSKVDEGVRREGWLINMHPTLIKDPDWPSGRAAVDYYFIQDDGGMFKCTFQYEPYFQIACKAGTETMIEEWLNKKYEGLICRIVRDKKEDLNLPNHLMGHRRLYLQLCFRNISDLLTVRRDIVPLALANGAKRDAVDAYAEVIRATADASMDIEFEEEMEGTSRPGKAASSRDMDPRECIVDVREYDVPYYLRAGVAYHEQCFAKCAASFAKNLIWIQGNDVAQRENERVDVFHVQIVRCNSIGDGVLCQNLRLLHSISRKEQ